MRTAHLGSSGLQVSELCLGAATFGRETDEPTAHAMLDGFVEAGGNFIDTAESYSQGASEEIVGRWLVGRDRHDVVIATKGRFGTRPGSNRSGLGRKFLRDAVEASLRRLGTDHIDLYQLHLWDPRTPFEETLSALDDLVRAGKLLYVGVSNFSGWQLQRIVDMARELGVARVASLQALYNLLDREAEQELVPAVEANGLGLMLWGPLRGGWLTGKFRRGGSQATVDTRIQVGDDGGGLVWTEAWANYDNDRTWRIIEALVAVAEEVGRTPAQVALNWVAGRPGVTAPIIGARDLPQLQENLGAVGWELAAEQRQRLTEVSHLPLPYPYGFIQDVTG